jgi:hypothetical protein
MNLRGRRNFQLGFQPQIQQIEPSGVHCQQP